MLLYINNILKKKYTVKQIIKQLFSIIFDRLTILLISNNIIINERKEKLETVKYRIKHT